MNKVDGRRKATKCCYACDTRINKKYHTCPDHMVDCVECGQRTVNRKYCSLACQTVHRSVDYSEVTINEITSIRKYQKNSVIRFLARRLYLRTFPEKSCANCGYSIHIEVCHIRGINDFPQSAKLAEVNSIDNLIGLCPNCHWELDHGELTIEIIKQSR